MVWPTAGYTFEATTEGLLVQGSWCSVFSGKKASSECFFFLSSRKRINRLIFVLSVVIVSKKRMSDVNRTLTDRYASFAESLISGRNLSISQPLMARSKTIDTPALLNRSSVGETFPSASLSWQGQKRCLR